MKDDQMTVAISEDVYEQMVDHARREAPQEACGILLGTNNQIDHYFPMTNINEGIDELLTLEGIDEQMLETNRERLSLHESDDRTVNINKASEECLAKLDGFDNEVAERIVYWRNRVGKFEEPEVHFKFHPQEYMEAQNQARQQGKDIIGIFHSHPHHDSRAYPSEDDRQMSHPGYIYFILNFQPDDVILRAFRIEDDEVVELEYRVEETVE